MTFGLYLLLNTVLIVLLALWLRSLVVRRLRPERVIADLRSEVQALVAELNQAGDQNVTVLEDRIRTLNGVVKDADTEIEELNKLIERARHLPAEGHGPTAADEEHLGTREPEPWPAREPARFTGFSYPAEENRPASDGVLQFSLHGPAGGADGMPVSESPEPEDEGAGTPDRDPREQVLELYAQGLSSELIAGRTGVAIGEVELIISLGERRRRR